jgi:hypothetical protein
MAKQASKPPGDGRQTVRSSLQLPGPSMLPVCFFTSSWRGIETLAIDCAISSLNSQ